MKKTLMTILLLSTVAGHTQTTPTCGTVAAQALNVQPLVVGAQQSVWYQDILNRCSNYVTDLMRARRQASQLAGMGQLNKAALLLANTLAQKAAEIPFYGEDTLYPHTVAAIKSGHQVVQALIGSSSSIPTQGGVLLGQVRYKTTARVYELIFHAYRQLDEKYFLNSVRTCYSGCHPWEQFGLPSSYYDGVRHLAQDFLELQKSEAPSMAFDNVELALAGETVSAAKNILLTSIFRRDYACIITDLHNLEWEIKSYNQCGGILPSHWFVDQVRMQINGIHIPARHCGSWTVYPR